MSLDPSSDVMILPSDIATIILVKKSQNSPYYSFVIDHFVGSLSFDGIEGSSIFPSKNSAFAALQKRYKIDFEKTLQAQALIGVANYGKLVYILLVKSSWPCARILNKHTIRLVNDIEYYSISLTQHRSLTPKETSRLSHLLDFPLSGHHFWCESHDFSTPLNSSLHDENFVWNEFWATPFSMYNQRDACINLLQGCAISRIITLTNRPFRFSLITIREAKFGGTRYVARGLDETGHAANEVQCELIVESDCGDVWSYIWRRGSAPVLWKTIVSKLGPSLSISQDYGRLTPIYFSRLLTLFSKMITCVNLMHNQPNHSERPLCDAYREAVSPIEFVRYLEFDWHGNVKTNGLAQTVQDLIKLFGDPSISYSKPPADFPILYYQEDPNTTEPSTASDNSNISNNNKKGKGKKANLPFQFSNESAVGETPLNFIFEQDSVVRVNCMDSLDRTNVACFFYAAYSISYILSEADIAKKVSSYEEILEMPEEIRLFLSEAFIQIGDCISFLYTNTPACMTNNFANISGIDSNRASDSSISIQRRYYNLLKDKNRQKAINLFVGQQLQTLLPKLTCGKFPSCVSSYPAQFMPPGVIDPNGTAYDPSILLSLSPQSLLINGAPTLVLELSEFTRVSFIAVQILPHGPISLSISGSLTFGCKLPLVKRVALPKVDTPTMVGIPIPPDYANHLDPYERFLYLEFSLAEGQTVAALGNIIVFGDEGTVTKESLNLFPKEYMILKVPDSSSAVTVDTRSDILSPRNFLHTRIGLNSYLNSLSNPNITVPNINLSVNPNLRVITTNSNSNSRDNIHNPNPTTKVPRSYTVIERNPNSSLPNKYPPKIEPTIQSSEDDSNKGRKSTLPVTVYQGNKLMPFNPSYLQVLDLEMSRLVHKMSRSELFCELRMANQDPNQWQADNFSIKSEPILNPNEKCSKGCGNDAQWKCYVCNKPFCEECEHPNKERNPFFYHDLAYFCQSCWDKAKLVFECAVTVSSLFKSFYSNYNENEKSSVLWYESHQPPHPLSPLNYPGAFFITTDNPQNNLVLTQNGGNITVPTSTTQKTRAIELPLSLQCVCDLTAVTVEGEDLNLIFKIDQSLQMLGVDYSVDVLSEPLEIQIKGKSSQRKELKLSGKFFTLIIKSGTLTKFLLEGKPVFLLPKKEEFTGKIPHEKKNLYTLITGKEKPLRAKINVQDPRTIQILFKQLTKVKAIGFASLTGVRLILISYYERDTKIDKDTSFPPDNCFPYYIPQGYDGKFILNLKEIRSVFKMEILFFECDEEFQCNNQIEVY